MSLEVLNLGEMVLIAGLSTVVLGATVREVYCFVQWRRTRYRMERQEWARVVRLLRD